jgi:hypothetical protein
MGLYKYPKLMIAQWWLWENALSAFQIFYDCLHRPETKKHDEGK